MESGHDSGDVLECDHDSGNVLESGHGSEDVEESGHGSSVDVEVACNCETGGNVLSSTLEIEIPHTEI